MVRRSRRTPPTRPGAGSDSRRRRRGAPGPPGRGDPRVHQIPDDRRAPTHHIGDIGAPGSGHVRRAEDAQPVRALGTPTEGHGVGVTREREEIRVRSGEDGPSSLRGGVAAQFTAVLS